MALTRSFKDIVKVRAERDPAFRDALVSEAVDHSLSGGLDTPKAVAHDYVDATTEIACLAATITTSSNA